MTTPERALHEVSIHHGPGRLRFAFLAGGGHGLPLTCYEPASDSCRLRARYEIATRRALIPRPGYFLRATAV
jgi:hypothetical protein